MNPPGDPPSGGGGATTKPPATATYTPAPLARSRPALKKWVARADGTPLPNLRVVGMERHEFAPWSCTLRYALVSDGSTLAVPGAPRRALDAFSLDARGRYVAQVDDRLRVMAPAGKKKARVLFDGFVVAVAPAVSDRGESLTVTLAAAPFRAWDTPLPGAVYRDADGLASAPNDGVDPARPQDVRTDLPVRFNPDGKGNRVANGGESALSPGATVEQKYPVFADEDLPAFLGGRAWSLADAVKYVLAIGGGDDQKYVLLPDFSDLDDLLTAIEPRSDIEPIDYDDDTTFTREDIVVPDVDVSGMVWPEAVRRLIEPHGFAFDFDLSTNLLGDPEWRLRIYRKDDTSNRRSLYLQAPGSAPSPGKSNAESLALTRDTAGIANRIVVNGKPTRYEAGIVLESLWLPSAGDLATPSLFVKDATGAARFNPDAYRLFGADECGEGHWNRISGGLSTTPADFSPLFDPPAPAPSGSGGKAGSIYGPPESAGAKKRPWVRRRRPALNDLVSLDDQGQPREPELWVSADYAGRPGPWDPALPSLLGPKGQVGGTWYRVSKDGWKLSDDRLGIVLTVDDPRNWSFADPTSLPAGCHFPSGILNIPAFLNGTLASKGQPVPALPRFCFRLVCAVEGDQMLDAVAGQRKASPTRFPITRYYDGRDRFRKRVVSRLSPIARDAAARQVPPAAPADAAPVDDTDDARAEAAGRRRAHECGALAGTAALAGFVDAYRPGDKLDGIVGVGVSLAQNAGRSAGESPVFPVIVGVSWTFDPAESTSFSIQDFRAEPPPKRRGRARTQ